MEAHAFHVLQGSVINQTIASTVARIDADATASIHCTFQSIPPTTHLTASMGTLQFKNVAATKGYPTYVIDEKYGRAKYWS